MNTDVSESMPAGPKRRFGGLKLFLLVAVVAVITSILTVWLTTTYLFPKEFKPVELSDREQENLSAKLERLDPTTRASTAARLSDDGNDLTPERYIEDEAKREVHFSEREVNALLAKNTDLARKLSIDLSQDLASAKLLLPLDPDFPILGGQTLKLTAGLELRYADGHPVVMLRGVSLWGVPIPNAWLGGIKNVDLVREFGGSGGFWKAFSDGVEYIRVEDGKLSVKLKE
ncbi:MAG: arginine N-succinyltransferase [Gammaproteobacteria bacterium]|nr:arginine N-succinyltransferase [Gammaproteobacteria bacterium]